VNFPNATKRAGVKSEYDQEFGEQDAVNAVVRSANRSLVLLSGNLPMRTEVTSVRILGSIENDNLEGAAAVAVVLLVISFAVIVILDVIQRRMVRRG